jgi:hypothetical protein
MPFPNEYVASFLKIEGEAKQETGRQLLHALTFSPDGRATLSF